MKRRPNSLNELKRAWTKANPGERDDFLIWIGTKPMPKPAFTTCVDSDRRLLPAVKARIGHITSTRVIEMGVVMTEMGFSPHDQSLSRAMIRPTRLRKAVADKLVKWLHANRHIT